jgi:hypothetical protein
MEMQTYKFWRVLSTALLVLTLLGVLAPSPAATRGQTPPGKAATYEPALCQFPAPNGGEVSVLNAVTSVPNVNGSAPRTMWAVGYASQQRVGTPGIATLTLYFNGRAWQVMPSPNVGVENMLTGVAAYAENDVWAVGHSYDGFEYDALILHWDGAAWKPWPVSLPEPDWVGPWDVHLTGIKAVSDTGIGLTGPEPEDVVVAVGYIEHLGTSQPLVLYYDGSAWQRLPLPPTLMNGRFYAVAGESFSNLWAVGTLDEEGQQVAYLFHRTPKGWLPIAKGLGALTSLAVTGDRVFTAGHVKTAAGEETLVMAYTMSSGDWYQIKSFSKFDADNVLTAVTTAAGKVYVVGYTANSADDVTRETLVLAYDGEAFTQIGSPNPAQTNELHGLVVQRGVLWTVGTSGQGAQRNTLVLNNNCVTTR